MILSRLTASRVTATRLTPKTISSAGGGGGGGGPTIPAGFTGNFTVTAGNGSILAFTGCTVTLLDSGFSPIGSAYNPTNGGTYTAGNPASFSIDEDAVTNVAYVQINATGCLDVLSDPSNGGVVDESAWLFNGNPQSNQFESISSGICQVISSNLGGGNIEVTGDLLIGD